MQTRYIKEIGTRVSLRAYWGDGCAAYGCHNAKRFITDLHGHNCSYNRDGHAGGEVTDYAEELWPRACDHCGEVVPADAKRQVFNDRLYNTASGKPEPGDLYHVDWYPEKMYFDNHTGPMLMAVLPNGREWLVDGRASNCTMPDERTHRCWVKHGDAEAGTLHVDKSGHTCNAGAGSIWVADYHGFLHNGKFTPNL